MSLVAERAAPSPGDCSAQMLADVPIDIAQPNGRRMTRTAAVDRFMHQATIFRDDCRK